MKAAGCWLVVVLAVLGGVLPGRAAAARFGPATSVQPPAPDPRFGIVESYLNPAAASEAGAGYTRIILRWDVIQPAGRDDWKPANVPDPIVEAELAAGREVVGLLIGTPGWATSPPAPPLGGEGSAGGEGGSRSVPDLYAWEAFARRMAQQYQGRIKHWVIWNEPDVWMEGHPGKTWDGTVEDYARLLKTAYLAIKGVDPAMTVHVAGMTYYWDWEHGRRRYLDRLLEVIAADPEAPANGYFFDGVTYHLYFNPLQTVDVLAETRQSLARYGIAGKEIWINETNAPPSDDPQELPWSTPRFRVSLEEQAAFILQEFALGFSSGASRIEVYKLRNTPDHPESIEPFGLLRGDDSRRPAFTAYQVAATYLGGFRSVRKEQRGDVVTVTFDRGDQVTRVLWTTGESARQVQVKASAAQALLVDEQGHVQPLQASNGVYTIGLPGATCSNGGGARCFIGGAPRLLVESGGAALPAVPDAAPTGPPPQPQASPTIPASRPTPRPTVRPWPKWKLDRLEGD